MKGFIDMVFLPGFAFQKRDNSVWWDKLLKNESARIIFTLDQPTWFYWLMYKRPSHHPIKLNPLVFWDITFFINYNRSDSTLSKKIKEKVVGKN